MAKKTDFSALTNSITQKNNLPFKEVFILQIETDEQNDTIYESRSEEDDDLLESIKELGILTPLTVIKNAEGDRPWKLKSGHRRLRQAIRLGMEKVPCYIMELKEFESEREKELAKMRILIDSNKYRQKSNEEIAREISTLEAIYKDLRSVNPEKYRGIKTRQIIANDLKIGERKVAEIQKSIKMKEKDETTSINSTVNRSKRRAYTQKALCSIVDKVSPQKGGSDDFISGYQSAKNDLLQAIGKEFEEGD